MGVHSSLVEVDWEMDLMGHGKDDEFEMLDVSRISQHFQQGVMGCNSIPQRYLPKLLHMENFGVTTCDCQG